MNITNLTYTEIQNLAIQADIESFNTGKTITLFDVVSYTQEAEKPRSNKPLPFFTEPVSNTPSLPNNINKRIRLRDHSNYAINNFLLVKESTLVNPDKNIISVESAIGKILKTADRGESFTYNGTDYTVIDIFSTPKVRQENA